MNDYQQILERAYKWRSDKCLRYNLSMARRHAMLAAEAYHILTQLLAAIDAAQGEAMFLLHTGTIYGNERGDWDIEANSGKAVDAYCDTNPGKTVGLYLAPQAPPTVVPAANDAVHAGVTLPHDFAQQIAEELRYLIDEVYGKHRRAYDREIELVRRLDDMLAAAKGETP